MTREALAASRPVDAVVEQACELCSRLHASCISCGTCTQRCHLLEEGEWNLGSLCAASTEALAGVRSTEELRRALEEHGELYRFARSCEACNRCTVRCPQALSMSDLWKPWRQLVRLGGFITDADVALVQVDSRWDTFSVYRALNGIDYDDLALLKLQPSGTEPDDAGSAPCAETLFFAGCTLCSYAPELTRAIVSWLVENLGPTLLATQCCAWPLECSGEVDRAKAWREGVIEAACAQGVRRIVGICPGCERQLAAASAVLAPHIEYVSLARLLVEAGVRVDQTMLEGVELPLAVVDSCNDRDGAHGPYVRRLFENVETRTLACTGQDAWCCGAGGNVAAYDLALSRMRTRRSFGMCAQAGARTLVAACPTCAYTYAFERQTTAREQPTAPPFVPSINYAEIVFGQRIDWPAVFGRLEDMWQGEHGAWVAERLS